MQEAGSESGEARRRRCQACHREAAEHHCQACRRYIGDACRAPPRPLEGGAGDDLEEFLQAALVRCRACAEDEVRLPPHDLVIEGG